MTKRRLGIGERSDAVLRAAVAVTMIIILATPVFAQREEAPKPGKPIKIGQVLSGELNAMLARAKSGKRVETYQITSEPRRLPPPHEFCNLETGPQTFELVTNGEAQVAELKTFVGKAISVKVGQIVCANDPGQVSEAVITKWSLVKSP